MNTFATAIGNQEARTENGMKARKATGNACTDLFFKIGAMRGRDAVPAFVSAFADDRDVALRIAAWARDIRQGAGERQNFRNIVKFLENTDQTAARALMHKVPELGRWDDLLVFETPALQQEAFALIKEALDAGHGLCAKWMPRKGPVAKALREYLGLSPKQYRKLLVGLTKVVETQMCAKQWSDINFSHVPSLASARYKKAFMKNASKEYTAYLSALANKDPKVKVNANAVYPYDVIKTIRRGDYEGSQLVTSQWEALPNYVGDASTLPLVDVSGSMTCGLSGSITPMDVAVSLGLYLADKNKGPFKDCFLTFSGRPDLVQLKGNIVQKTRQMSTAHWEGSTNLHAAFDKILDTAVQNKVPQSEMPETLLILSDMQFNSCVSYDDSAIQMIERKYKSAGYTMPRVVFWNINARDNVPVEFNRYGVALVSGFSPSIMKSILSGKEFTPEAIMLETVMNPRYNM